VLSIDAWLRILVGHAAAGGPEQAQGGSLPRRQILRPKSLLQIWQAVVADTGLRLRLGRVSGGGSLPNCGERQLARAVTPLAGIAPVRPGA